MSHFEYVSAGYILMLTFAAARLLAGAAHVIEPRRLYWVHTSWAALAAMLCLTPFWAFWAYREIEWTLPKLIVLLSTPSLLYVFCSILVPGDPSAVSSWRDYFFEVRIPLFVSGVLLILSIILGNQFLLGVPPTHPTQISAYGCVGIYATGALSRAERTHNVLALAPPLLIALMLVTMAPADWFGR